MGETTIGLSIDFRKEHFDIPWKDIAGMRDKLIHDYFGVDIETVWDTIVMDIPSLKEQIEGIMK